VTERPRDAGFSVEFPGRAEELGKCLRNLRDEKGIDLEEIAQLTKVSRRVFEALESGSYEQLPQKVFCRNFLRQYGEIIGLEIPELLEAFDRAWERFQMASGSYASFVVDERPRRVIHWWLWAPALLGVLVLGVLGTMMVRSCRGETELQRDPRRSVVATVVPSPTVGNLPVPFAATVAPSPPPEEPAPPAVSFRVSVLPGRECWIRYRDHHGVMGQDLLRAGGSREFELPSPILLTLGNADAAVISLGDKKFGKLGSPGQVVHLEIDHNQLRKLEPGEVDGG